MFFFFFSSRRRHTRLVSDWSSDVCSSDLDTRPAPVSQSHPRWSAWSDPQVTTRLSKPCRALATHAPEGRILGGGLRDLEDPTPATQARPTWPDSGEVSNRGPG